MADKKLKTRAGRRRTTVRQSSVPPQESPPPPPPKQRARRGSSVPSSTPLIPIIKDTVSSLDRTVGPKKKVHWGSTVETTKTALESSVLKEANESPNQSDVDENNSILEEIPKSDIVEICPDYPMKIVRMDLDEGLDWHLFTIFNMSNSRVAWTIEAQNRKRLSFEPARDTLEGGKFTTVKIIIHPFDKAEELGNDEITVKWVNAPEGGERFKLKWFKEGKEEIQSKTVPVTYIE